MNTDCETCRYFSKGPLFEQGECRRHAPVIGHPDSITGDDGPGRYPQMRTTGFGCGEHAMDPAIIPEGLQRRMVEAMHHA